MPARTSAPRPVASSVPHIGRSTGGELDKCWAFDAKADIEAYIRSLPNIQCAFFDPGAFMQNYHNRQKPLPVENVPGTYKLASFLKPETKLPLIDIMDTGKLVGAILTVPDKYAGKVFCAETRLYSMTEIVEILSKITGQKIPYQQIPDGVVNAHLPPAIAEGYLQISQYYRDYGYYGAEMEKKVQWVAEQALGNLTTLEEFLTREPHQLDYQCVCEDNGKRRNPDSRG